METLLHYANLAHKILNENTQYKKNKIIISEYFKTNIADVKNMIYCRLALIDGFYSTQMNKRLYGIEDLSKEIAKTNDVLLIKESEEFLRNPFEGNVIKSLLSKSYGIGKSGNKKGKAISLISKYLYFLNDYNFPIYDSLVVESYKILKNGKINENNFFETIKSLNESSCINNYEKLDNLLWLIGKINNGSFSSILEKSSYCKIISNQLFKHKLQNVPAQKPIKSAEYELLISNFLKEEYKNLDIFTAQQIEFLEFVYCLKDNSQ